MDSVTDFGCLDGKVAIVTGSSSGIGAATAVALSRAGAKVAMAARRVDRLKEIEKNITEDEGIAISVKTDVTQRSEVGQIYSGNILNPRRKPD